MPNHSTQTDRRVANRAMCLGVLLKRHGLELGIQSVKDLPDEIRDGWRREHEGIHQHLKQWCVEEKLIDQFSEDERLLIDADLGAWQQLDRATIRWRSESLGIMLWALNTIDVPYYDTQFDVEALLIPLDLMNPTIDFMWCATVIEGGVIHQARDLAETWHWRAHMQEQLLDNPEHIETVHRVAHEMYEAGNLPELLNDDFPVLGKAYADLNSDEYNKIASIAKERHYALNWLCRQSDNWDDVSIEIADK